jgi:tripartite-type tricarboxylate transporter receptor subunit TctC
MKRFCHALLFTVIVSVGANAQDAPVRILVGFPPGGGTDVVARMLAEKMKDSLGSPVVIENRPGAGGQLAAKLFKAAAPDGRMLMATASAPITLAAFQKLDYDPVKDFAPVSLAATFQLALVVGPAVPVKSLDAYVAWIRAHENDRTYGTAAAGSLPHLLGSLLAKNLRLDMVHVPYNGGAPLLSAVAGGQVGAAIMLLSEALPMHRAGKVAVLATTGTARSAQAPDIATFLESGFPEVVATGWIAFFLPANTPRSAIDRLSGAIAAAVKAPDMAERLVKAGFEPVGSSPEMLGARVASDMQTWGPVARGLGLGDR